MFKSARLKLTAWYLLIIMIISISFSSFIYLGLTREFDRILRIQEYRLENPQSRHTFIPRPIWQNEDIPFSKPPDPMVIAEAKSRIAEGLLGINIIILVFSSLAGYFLAGRTLRPIKNMVDEQNRFITDASHELNTPLTALKTSIEVNLRNKKFNLENAKKVLLSNLEEANNLQLLSAELIKITQYQKPNGNFQFSKVSLKEVVETSINRVLPISEKKHIKISEKIKDIKITAEKRSLTELFTILLDNAIKYSSENKEVYITSEKTDHKIKIIVKDNGFGIDKNHIPFIFDRFYRADSSRTKQNVSGYGLGLSIAKKITELHKGSISVESKINKGTSFIVTLPVG
ncbi:MAG TPA: HAMP domain-containing sensor histidine kinase [Candidatus Sulfotelmatobacter sp.]|nr:HAMP domain-containing sensor histidine kinase [Candidatus Sulfotelmatobacter sp.]